jgi:cell division protein FtsA
MFGEKFYCGIDIGSQKLKASIIKTHDHKVELVETSECRTRGFRDCSVSDLSEFSDCIQQAVNNLIKKTNFKIKDVHLGINGELVEAREISAVIPVADKGSKVIGQRDIHKVNEQARLLGTKIEEEILHELPQYYKVDDVNMALNPAGLFGRKLGVHSIIVVTSINRVRNITRAINQAGFDVGSLSFGSFAASGVALTNDERTEGTVLVDVGSCVTSILIFNNGVLRFLNHIQIGGDHLTKKIADQLNISFDMAEDIKKSYAGALSTDSHHQEEILIKKEENFTPLKREALYQAISGEIERLVGTVQMTIKESGLYDKMSGMVLIGGGSLLPGLIERMGHEINLPAKIGKINGIGQSMLCNAATYSSAVGIALKGFQSTHSYRANADADDDKWTKRLSNKIKELYYEYF